MSELKHLYRTATNETFPDKVTVIVGDKSRVYRKVTWPDINGPVGLRYGENPHQAAAYYAPARVAGKGLVDWVKQGKGGPSWTNLADIDHAMRILRFLDAPTVAIMKHLNPAGVASQADDRNLAALIHAARACDDRAAFGGVVVANRLLDAEAATAILAGYVEVVAAPAFSDEALAIFETKPDLRVAKLISHPPHQPYAGDPPDVDIKILSDGSMILQAPYSTRVRSADDLILTPLATRNETTVQVLRTPDAAQLQDLLFAWYVNTGVRSNGIVIARGGKTLAVGTGEQDRIGAVEQAIAKAHQRGHNLRGAVVSSDGFFPFRDAIDTLASAGIVAVTQPGGSVRDDEVIAACNAHRMAMVFTGERCFGHF
ncbi:MAG: IMP cyclohydrolase [Candidatus Sericytochromatia bacterium]|nr:IMP cyclohydrolase [Candidatus Sericytochromatia bacterium]